MKKRLFIITLIIFAGFINACVDTFLEKPDTTGTVDLDKVFSTTKDSEAALFLCYYTVLRHGWPLGFGLNHSSLGSLSGELCRGQFWHSIYTISSSGLSATGARPIDEQPGAAGADCMPQTWAYIRACLVVKENIDKVADMNETMKGYIKGEAIGLIAYRYMGMFYRYGGVPIVRKSFTSNDDLALPRVSLQEMLDYILELCDEAYNALPDSWASIDGGKYVGRLTKGAVLAMKARVLMFAARPLFNSATPYLPFAGNEQLICFGNADPERWQDAIAANEAVLTWATANGYRLLNTGGAGIGQANPNAADDYGNACSLPNNEEVILAYHIETGPEPPVNYVAHPYNTSPYWTNNRYDSQYRGMLGNFLVNYYDKNGNDIDWPEVGESAPRPISDWVNKMENIEPRFRIDLVVPGMKTLSNPDDPNWQPDLWNREISNYEIKGSGAPSDIFPDAANIGLGCGENAKFYYKAGPRTWFHPPLFRLAETYLNLAEAYNEAGDATNALKNLNMVHNRAGLPAITETNKDLLRTIIWREKAIEYFNENHRYYDVKHWKHPDIGTEIIGGPRRELQFLTTTNSNELAYFELYWMANSYESVWYPRMFLEPWHQDEINKGIIIQNPGY